MYMEEVMREVMGQRRSREKGMKRRFGSWE